MASRSAIAVLLLAVVLGTAMASSPAEEAKALLDFKAAVKNPRSDIQVWQILDTWTGANPCDPNKIWDTVYCVAGHVNTIGFYSLGTDDQNDEITPFNCNIGPTFAKLDQLKWFAIPLKKNAFPLVLTSLRNLEYLHVEGLTSSIPPQIGQLRKLKFLTLRKGRLGGSIPAEIGLLTSLKSLVLDTNKLSGPIPTTIAKLTKLTMLNTFFNRLDAPLPKELGKLTKLIWLYVGYNKIPGPIPTEIAKMSSLKFIEISDNKLSGPIPPQIALLKKLYRFRASNNRFTGPVPSKFASVPQVFLDSNYLTGTAASDDYHTYGLNCLNITACTRAVPGQRSFAKCLKVYPSLGSPCRV